MLQVNGQTLALVLGADTLDLMDRATNGLAISEINIGMPDIREVLEPVPGADGNADYTALYGTRVISLTGMAFPAAIGSRQAALAQLLRFTRPNTRPQLVYQFDADTVPRVVTLRSSDWTAPVNTPGLSAFTVAFKAASPVAVGLTTNVQTFPPLANFNGRTYPRTYNLTYPAGYGGAGIATVTTAGDYQTWPVIRMFGPLTNPTLVWQDGSGQIVFTGLTVNQGDYLQIDTAAKTVNLNGDPNANRYSFLDFTQTVWAPLQPGDNVLRFSATSANAPAIVEIDWSDAWLF